MTSKTHYVKNAMRVHAPKLIGRPSKPQRRRQRERHQTKGLMSRTIAVYVRF